ncbi:MAG: FecR domain-containing protein [Deltaproteobacteria bacterium]|nr:FecR domain-containing protein [Deltaproteobacteria bacterium]
MTVLGDSSTNRPAQEAVVAAVAAHMQARFTEHTARDGRAQFLARVAARPRRVWIPLALAVGAMALVLLFVMPRPLTVMSTHVSLDEHLHFRVEQTAGQLQFSDGSQATLEPGAVGSLLRLDSHGADLRLSTGQIDIKVKKRRGARWAVLAGPYQVRVTGTHFQVRWLDAAGRFAIRMWEGEVVVQGPGLAGGRALSAGQSLELPLQPVVVPNEKPFVPAPVVGTLMPEPPHTRPRSSPGGNWKDLVAQGKYQMVLAEATRHGLPRVLKHASLDQLAALADAGRYGGNAHIAKQALLAQRKHFPRSERAVMAAYLLGRLAEDAGQPKAAVGWYDLYLYAGKHQALAEESLGRKMLALERAGLAEATLKVARAYKRQYPNGSFFHAAQRIEAIHSPK